MPAATATASSSVDLPLPFSPSRYATLGCSGTPSANAEIAAKLRGYPARRSPCSGGSNLTDFTNASSITAHTLACQASLSTSKRRRPPHDRPPPTDSRQARRKLDVLLLATSGPLIMRRPCGVRTQRVRFAGAREAVWSSPPSDRSAERSGLRMPRPRGSEELFDWSVHTTKPVIDSSSRRERDSLGEVTVPATAYWGVNTRPERWRTSPSRDGPSPSTRI
jgi:hypothetical protein